MENTEKKNKKNGFNRIKSRDVAFKLVFEFCINKEANEDTLNEFLENDETLDGEYIKNVYYGVIKEFDALKEEIAKVSKDFTIDRIFKIDLALLLVSLYEIKFVEDIPVPVSINEALNLAKIYSTEKSSVYINGILSNFARK